MPTQTPDYLNSIIAACGVLLGVIVSQATSMLALWNDRKQRRREMLLAKLDELAVEDQTVLHWLSQFRACRTLLEMQLLPPSLPLSRMESLTALYFDNLKQPVAKYSAALRSYNEWAFSQVQTFSKDGTFPNPLAWCLIQSDNDSDARHRKDIQLCHRSFADAVAAEAKLLLK